MKTCPACAAPLASDVCAACGALWLAGLADAPGRRLAGKGPVAPGRCADCGGGLKSLDVPGALHEGDLFWGLESARPAGSFVAEGCARCGGVLVAAHDLARAGGRDAAVDALRRLFAGAS